VSGNKTGVSPHLLKRLLRKIFCCVKICVLKNKLLFPPFSGKFCVSKKEKFRVLQLRRILILSLAVCGLASYASAQNPAPSPTPQNQENKNKPVTALPTGKNQNLNAEQVAEIAIIAYGGRPILTQIRKTELETGRTTRFLADGKTEESSYERRVMRGESLEKDRVRVNQRLPQAEYALIYDAAKTFGIINNTTFTPREEADRSFQAQIFHGLDVLLRYKENGSTLKLAGKEKSMGVEYYALDVIDKQNRTTRFNISAKLFRVQSLEYTESLTAGGAPVKFVRKFSDYRPAQGTLVAYLTRLSADGKQIEENNVLTVTYGMRIEETQFQAE
jgi:hypothetical protein